MTTDSQQAASPPPPPAGFWKIRHAVIGLGVLIVLVMMMRACSDDEPEQHADSEADKPRQSIAVQIPASQWPAQQTPPQYAAPPQPGYGYAPPQSGAQSQPGYGYAPPQYAAPPQPGYGYAPAPVQQPQAPAPADNNPWAVQKQPPGGYGQYRSQQWGQPQPRQPQYVQPSTGLQYRPLEPESTAPQAPAVQQSTPGYQPVAPYDRITGSSFNRPYPYGGAYPGYYGQGMYGMPGGGYAPGWPGAVPGMGWPGYW
jgi:hypothetical protein